MDKAKLAKLALSALGVGLTLVSTMVNDKVKDTKLEETVAKKVAEALADQAKES